MSGNDHANDEPVEYFDERTDDFLEAFGEIDDESSPVDTAESAESSESAPAVLDRAMPDSALADEAYVRAGEARNAIARASAIAAGRRKGGVAGAALAGAMFAVAEIYEGPRKDKTAVVVEASSDPNDVDVDGVEVTVGDVSVASPALERLDPVSERDSRKRPVV